MSYWDRNHSSNLYSWGVAKTILKMMPVLLKLCYNGYLEEDGLRPISGSEEYNCHECWVVADEYGRLNH